MLHDTYCIIIISKYCISIIISGMLNDNLMCILLLSVEILLMTQWILDGNSVFHSL